MPYSVPAAFFFRLISMDECEAHPVVNNVCPCSITKHRCISLPLQIQQATQAIPITPSSSHEHARAATAGRAAARLHGRACRGSRGHVGGAGGGAQGAGKCAVQYMWLPWVGAGDACKRFGSLDRGSSQFACPPSCVCLPHSSLTTTNSNSKKRWRRGGSSCWIRF